MFQIYNRVPLKLATVLISKFSEIGYHWRKIFVKNQGQIRVSQYLDHSRGQFSKKPADDNEFFAFNSYEEPIDILLNITIYLQTNLKEMLKHLLSITLVFYQMFR